MNQRKHIFPILALCACSIFIHAGNVEISGKSPLVNQLDSLELVKFYTKFNGPGWTKSNNWLVSGQPIDTWFGVTVDMDGFVTSISLPDNNLTGVLYDLQFPHLLELDLSFNAVGGNIPDFTNLPDLTVLKLYVNQLSGTVPDFSNLPDLTLLWLGRNKLSGSLPNFSNLAAINNLDLSFNQLSGPIPDFSNLPVLGALYLNSNRLSGPVPDFSNLPLLGKLSLYENKLSGELPDFQNLPNLIDLLLTNNRLTGNIPDFSNLPNLLRLQLSFNRLSGAIPNFSNLPKLSTLELSQNQLSGAIPDFSNSPLLDFLYLDNNLLSGAIPNFSGLTRFTIYNNQFVFSDLLSSGNLGAQGFSFSPQNPFYQDTLISGVKGQPITIDLGIDASLPDNVYQWVKNGIPWTPPAGNNINSNKLIFSSPEAADAGRYTVTVVNPQVPGFKLNSQTIRLKVCYERLDSLELVQLFNQTNGASWTNMENWNTIGMPINTWYGITTRPDGCVQKIDLSNNNLTGTLPALNLNTLDTLILENNFLTDTIPELHTPFVRAVNLSKNQLTGTFPNALQTWVDLHALNLGNNFMNNSIPPVLGDLCELTALQLNNNQFVGELPEQLTMLFNLQVGQVDFSHNMIDSLKEKLIWFCPYGDHILDNNPSYDRFLGICNQQCTGLEWDNLADFPWIEDTLDLIDCNAPGCMIRLVQAGYTSVRGVNVVFVQNRCITNTEPLEYDEVVRFFDCGGHLLETVHFNLDEYLTSYMAITLEEFLSLTYDIRWSCGQTAEIGTPTIEPDPGVATALNILPCSPNPAETLVLCEGESLTAGSLQLVDLLGRNASVSYQMEGNQLRMDVSKLPRGLYLVTLQGKKGRYVAKVAVR